MNVLVRPPIDIQKKMVDGVDDFIETQSLSIRHQQVVV